MSAVVSRSRSTESSYGHAVQEEADDYRRKDDPSCDETKVEEEERHNCVEKRSSRGEDFDASSSNSSEVPLPLEDLQSIPLASSNDEIKPLKSCKIAPCNNAPPKADDASVETVPDKEVKSKSQEGKKNVRVLLREKLQQQMYRKNQRGHNSQPAKPSDGGAHTTTVDEQSSDSVRTARAGRKTKGTLRDDSRLISLFIEIGAKASSSLVPQSKNSSSSNSHGNCAGRSVSNSVLSTFDVYSMLLKVDNLLSKGPTVAGLPRNRLEEALEEVLDAIENNDSRIEKDGTASAFSCGVPPTGFVDFGMFVVTLERCEAMRLEAVAQREDRRRAVENVRRKQYASAGLARSSSISRGGPHTPTPPTTTATADGGADEETQKMSGDCPQAEQQSENEKEHRATTRPLSSPYRPRHSRSNSPTLSRNPSSPTGTGGYFLTTNTTRPDNSPTRYGKSQGIGIDSSELAFVALKGLEKITKTRTRGGEDEKEKRKRNKRGVGEEDTPSRPFSFSSDGLVGGASPLSPRRPSSSRPCTGNANMRAHRVGLGADNSRKDNSQHNESNAPHGGKDAVEVYLHPLPLRAASESRGARGNQKHTLASTYSHLVFHNQSDGGGGSQNKGSALFAPKPPPLSQLIVKDNFVTPDRGNHHDSLQPRAMGHPIPSAPTTPRFASLLKSTGPSTSTAGRDHNYRASSSHRTTLPERRGEETKLLRHSSPRSLTKTLGDQHSKKTLGGQRIGDVILLKNDEKDGALNVKTHFNNKPLRMRREARRLYKITNADEKENIESAAIVPSLCPNPVISSQLARYFSWTRNGKEPEKEGTDLLLLQPQPQRPPRGGVALRTELKDLLRFADGHPSVVLAAIKVCQAFLLSRRSQCIARVIEMKRAREQEEGRIVKIQEEVEEKASRPSSSFLIEGVPRKHRLPWLLHLESGATNSGGTAPLRQPPPPFRLALRVSSEGLAVLAQREEEELQKVKDAGLCETLGLGVAPAAAERAGVVNASADGVDIEANSEEREHVPSFSPSPPTSHSPYAPSPPHSPSLRSRREAAGPSQKRPPKITPYSAQVYHYYQWRSYTATHSPTTVDSYVPLSSSSPSSTSKKHQHSAPMLSPTERRIREQKRKERAAAVIYCFLTQSAAMWRRRRIEEKLKAAMHAEEAQHRVADIHAFVLGKISMLLVQDMITTIIRNASALRIQKNVKAKVFAKKRVKHMREARDAEIERRIEHEEKERKISLIQALFRRKRSAEKYHSLQAAVEAAREAEAQRLEIIHHRGVINRFAIMCIGRWARVMRQRRIAAILEAQIAVEHQDYMDFKNACAATIQHFFLMVTAKATLRDKKRMVDDKIRLEAAKDAASIVFQKYCRRGNAYRMLKRKLSQAITERDLQVSIEEMALRRERAAITLQALCRFVCAKNAVSELNGRIQRITDARVLHEATNEDANGDTPFLSQFESDRAQNHKRDRKRNADNNGKGQPSDTAKESVKESIIVIQKHIRAANARRLLRRKQAVRDASLDIADRLGEEDCQQDEDCSLVNDPLSSAPSTEQTSKLEESLLVVGDVVSAIIEQALVNTNSNSKQESCQGPNSRVRATKLADTACVEELVEDEEVKSCSRPASSSVRRAAALPISPFDELHE